MSLLPLSIDLQQTAAPAVHSDPAAAADCCFFQIPVILLTGTDYSERINSTC
jgi:hypothetical protein